MNNLSLCESQTNHLESQDSLAIKKMDLQTRINIAQHIDGPAYWAEMEEIRRLIGQSQSHQVTVVCTVFEHIKPVPIEEQIDSFLASDRATVLSEKDRVYLKKLAKIPII